MGYHQQEYIRKQIDKEVRMDITVTDNVTGEVSTLADERQKTLTSFRQIINNLPWEDINTGNFSPEAGCTTVAEVRDRLISLGCNREALMAGVEREYVATVTTEVTLTYTFSADSEEDAETHAQDLLYNEHLSSYTADEVEIEAYSADISVEVKN